MLRLDLKKIRKNLSLTQKELSEIFKVPQSFISQIENGKDSMPGSWIPELKRMLNIPDLSSYQLAVKSQSDEDILKRLKVFFEKTGLPFSQIALQLGLTQRIVTNVINGKAKMDLTILLSIATGFPKLNMNWLISGSGEMYEADSSQSFEQERTRNIVDAIAMQQATIREKEKEIADLKERIKLLESQLKSIKK